MFFGGLDPNYTVLLFPDPGLEKPDFAVLEDIRSRVLLEMERVHTRNLERVQNHNFTVREIYSRRSLGVMASW